jgi:lipopolysaccharide biosynthesis protein
MKIKINKKRCFVVFFSVVVLMVMVYYYIHMRHKNKDAIFYSYFEKNELYKENFIYFLKHVVKPLHKSADIYIIINGECSVPLPDLPNVRIIRRKNEGYDFGAYSHCITHHVVNEYDYYIFINTSVRGPIPPSVDWRTKFKKLFTKDVGLVGVSINMSDRDHNIALSNGKKPPTNNKMQTHVQSMFFILNKEVFLYLKENKKFFSDEEILNKTTDMWDIIMAKEIGMTQYVMEGGWNINCILSKYQGHDYRTLEVNINPSCDHPYLKGSYFGKDVKPEEAIFHKISLIGL